MVTAGAGTESDAVCDGVGLDGAGLAGGRHRAASAGLGRGAVDPGPEPRGRLHHHGEGGRDLADAEVHHLQPHPPPGGRGQCQCPGGQSRQEVTDN